MVWTFLSSAQQEAPEESRWKEIFDQILTFLYTIAHGAGQWIAQLVERITGYAFPNDLIDPLGVLILLTLFLVITEVTKRVAWGIVIVGWVLILIRIVLEIF